MLKPLMSSGVDVVSASALRMTAGFGAHALLWALGLGVAGLALLLQRRR